MVVRNRCEATGNEEILVKAAKFAQRYEGPIGPAGADGWLPYRPTGVEMRYLTLGPNEGPFSFIAPWGEPMVAKPGDAIVQDPNNAKDTYRIAAGRSPAPTRWWSPRRPPADAAARPRPGAPGRGPRPQWSWSAWSASSLRCSATMASVVTSRPATEAACCRAVRTTLVGSMMPLATRSPNSPAWAS